MTSAILTMSMASAAVRPWESLDAMTAPYSRDGTTQAQKDYCLYSCPYADDCACCDSCDGFGHLMRGKGRPRAVLDEASILEAIKTHKIAAVSRMYGISRNTIYRLIRSKE